MEIKSDKEIKCIIWDLDNTIWDGTLLESDAVHLKPGIKEAIVELDARGILHSIASKNEYECAVAKLKEFGIYDYFLYPEINWNAKSESVKRIRRNLNIGMDNILFIDDQLFELEEVANCHETISVIDIPEPDMLLMHDQLRPSFITEDSRRRRTMYLEDIERRKYEEKYVGPKEEFLASLNMKFSISIASEDDLARAEELTVRTNQLNTTGLTYSYSELSEYIHSVKYELFVCELEDKYGTYGKIGLALIEYEKDHWSLRLLLMSCRIISRNVGNILLSYIMFQAKLAGKKLRADFKQTEKNKVMYVTYKFSNFKEVENDGNGNIVFENDLTYITPYPKFVEVLLPDTSFSPMGSETKTSGTNQF